ncbi:MAG: hypothetical protein KBC02_02225 [Candidatus Pacebacteria bacterium]|nr:hypothetical protein [Candidatus Paceibacterota bacterium]
MTITYFIIGIVVGIIIGRVMAAKSGGRDGAADAVRARKEEAKAKIMGLFAGGKSEIANDDVQRLLGVSDATVTNYLSELESSGRISQIGTTGHSVRYRRNG